MSRTLVPTTGSYLLTHPMTFPAVCCFCSLSIYYIYRGVEIVYDMDELALEESNLLSISPTLLPVSVGISVGTLIKNSLFYELSEQHLSLAKCSDSHSATGAPA